MFLPSIHLTQISAPTSYLLCEVFALNLLRPVPSIRVVDAVHQRIRQAILTGELPPGARLSVPDLARRLDVSRSPIREAVLHLVAEGLAVEHSRRGAEVARVNLSDLLEIYAVRAALEGLAAQLCAESMSAADLTALRGVLDAQGAPAVSGDVAGYRELDLRFHQIIVQSCGNSRLAKSAEQLTAELSLATRLMADSAEHLRASHTEHRRIVAALIERRPDEAERAMREHLARVSGAVQAKVAAQSQVLSGPEPPQTAPQTIFSNSTANSILDHSPLGGTS
ncbi:GntR family transcriptional regulator [Deinococcus detaillensis]|uniref:GntR family transcriptional regulator n=1 Tax=Deinococcus detaillensis TaxID=2592048 RepID=A0A553V4Y9_9DEIO|nr:GntR family transcriptional regulator [Deinococcus detaillensis]